MIVFIFELGNIVFMRSMCWSLSYYSSNIPQSLFSAKIRKLHVHDFCITIFHENYHFITVNLRSLHSNRESDIFQILQAMKNGS